MSVWGGYQLLRARGIAHKGSHLVALLEQHAGEPPADEPGRPGQEVSQRAPCRPYRARARRRWVIVSARLPSASKTNPRL